MLFLPYTVELQLNRKPVITVLVCLLCLWVFICQPAFVDSGGG